MTTGRIEGTQRKGLQTAPGFDKALPGALLVILNNHPCPDPWHPIYPWFTRCIETGYAHWFFRPSPFRFSKFTKNCIVYSTGVWFYKTSCF